MAGATHLVKDIEALVDKYSDVALPVDLLSRFAEEARLMAVREKIRSLHEEDALGLFSPADETPTVNDDDGDEHKHNCVERGSGDEQDANNCHDADDDGADSLERPTSQWDPTTGQRKLPEHVKRMLSAMKVKRLDEVTALSGFTTIDAEVAFFTDDRGNIAMPKTSDSNCTTNTTSSSSTMINTPPAMEVVQANGETRVPVHLHFRFRREPMLDVGGQCKHEHMADEDGVNQHDIDGNEDGNEQSNGREREGEGNKKHSSDEVIDLALEDAGGKQQQREERSKSEESDEGIFAGVLKLVSSRMGDGVNVGTENGAKGDHANTSELTNGESHASRTNGDTLSGERRKRGCGVDIDDTRGGGRGRKRSKGGGSLSGSGWQGAGGEGSVRAQEGERERDSESDEDMPRLDDDEGGLGFDPRTIVSYSIAGGIGFRPPETLLQAVIYARGIGPACVMSSPKEDGDEGAGVSDQDDVFDCNVDAEALASIGQSLGLHSPPVEDSDATVKHDPNFANFEGKKGAFTVEGDGDETEGMDEKMTVEDLVWWLMMFPFFEKDFDVLEVVASSVFGGDNDSEDEDEGENSGDEEESDDGEFGLTGAENEQEDGPVVSHRTMMVEGSE